MIWSKIPKLPLRKRHFSTPLGPEATRMLKMKSRCFGGRGLRSMNKFWGPHCWLCFSPTETPQNQRSWGKGKKRRVTGLEAVDKSEFENLQPQLLLYQVGDVDLRTSETSWQHKVEKVTRQKAQRRTKCPSEGEQAVWLNWEFAWQQGGSDAGKREDHSTQNFSQHGPQPGNTCSISHLSSNLATSRLSPQNPRPLHAPTCSHSSTKHFSHICNHSIICTHLFNRCCSHYQTLSSTRTTTFILFPQYSQHQI